MSSDTKHIRLRADAGIPTAEVFVVDGRLELAVDAATGATARGFGRLDVTLHPGAYKVKVKVGARVIERLVSLVPAEPIVTVQFDAKEIAALTGFSFQHDPAAIEAYWQAIERLASRVNIQPRQSQVAVFVRTRARHFLPNAVWLIDSENHVKGSVIGDPNNSDTDKQGEDWIVEQFQNETVYAMTWSALAGNLRLGMRFPGGRIIERSLFSIAGHASQLFTRCDVDVGVVENATTLLIGATVGFDGSRERELRLAAVARAQLATGRVPRESDLMEGLLGGKFEEPMLGLYAAHLLLASNSATSTLMGNIVSNLERLMPNAPDVQLLRSVIEDGPLPSPWHPPLLRASWDLYLTRSYLRPPDPNAPESLVDQISGRVLASPSWLIWKGVFPTQLRKPKNRFPSLPRAPKDSLASTISGETQLTGKEGAPSYLKFNPLERSILETYFLRQDVPRGRLDLLTLAATRLMPNQVNANEMAAEIRRGIGASNQNDLVSRFRVTPRALDTTIKKLSKRLFASSH